MFVVERVQRLAGAAKKLPVPEGTWAIGAGLIIVGLSAYGFQILAAKRLSDRRLQRHSTCCGRWCSCSRPACSSPSNKRSAARWRPGGSAARAAARSCAAAALLGLMLALAVAVACRGSRTGRSSTTCSTAAARSCSACSSRSSATTSRSSPGARSRATGASARTASCTGPRAPSASSRASSCSSSA